MSRKPIFIDWNSIRHKSNDWKGQKKNVKRVWSHGEHKSANTIDEGHQNAVLWFKDVRWLRDCSYFIKFDRCHWTAERKDATFLTTFNFMFVKKNGGIFEDYKSNLKPNFWFLPSALEHWKHCRFIERFEKSWNIGTKLKWNAQWNKVVNEMIVGNHFGMKKI